MGGADRSLQVHMGGAEVHMGGADRSLQVHMGGAEVYRFIWEVLIEVYRFIWEVLKFTGSYGRC